MYFKELNITAPEAKSLMDSRSNSLTYLITMVRNWKNMTGETRQKSFESYGEFSVNNIVRRNAYASQVGTTLAPGTLEEIVASYKKMANAYADGMYEEIMRIERETKAVTIG